MIDETRELNGHPDDEVKRQRNHVLYANELYNTTMWNAPNQNPHNNQQQQPQQQQQPPQPQPHEAAKWGPQPVKEEPKNNIPLPEILENSSGSPHVSDEFLSKLSYFFGIMRQDFVTFVEEFLCYSSF